MTTCTEEYYGDRTCRRLRTDSFPYLLRFSFEGPTDDLPDIRQRAALTAGIINSVASDIEEIGHGRGDLRRQKPSMLLPLPEILDLIGELLEPLIDCIVDCLINRVLVVLQDGCRKCTPVLRR